MTTIKDVARRAEVSVTTVSRVINDDPTVRTPVRRAVEKAIKDLGYQPNLAARSLRTTRTGVIGVAFPAFSPPAARMFEGIERVATERGYEVILAIARGPGKRELNRMAALFQRRLDGVLWLPDEASEASMESLAETAHSPVVAFGLNLPLPKLPTVTTTIEPGLIAAMDDLYALGHRQIAFLSESNPPRIGKARFNMATGLIAEGRWPGVELVNLGPTTPGNLEQVIADLAASDRRATALFILDETCLGPIMAKLAEHHLAVPEDVSILLFSHAEQAGWASPRVASLGVDLEKYGERAARVLFEAMDTGAEPLEVRSEPAFYVRRESVAQAPGGPVR